jgi:hypothetical protein
MSSHLVEMGQQALAGVSLGVAGGAPLVKCQLLASEFYEAIRQELKKPSLDSVANRTALIAAANQCHQVAIASLNPNGMLTNLKRAVDLLNSTECPSGDLSEPPRGPPVLRVIQGGLPSA